MPRYAQYYLRSATLIYATRIYAKLRLHYRTTQILVASPNATPVKSTLLTKTVGMLINSVTLYLFMAMHNLYD